MLLRKRSPARQGEEPSPPWKRPVMGCGDGRGQKEQEEEYMNIRLDGQTAVVFGAGRGIGEAIVTELA